MISIHVMEVNWLKTVALIGHCKLNKVEVGRRVTTRKDDDGPVVKFGCSFKLGV